MHPYFKTKGKCDFIRFFQFKSNFISAVFCIIGALFFICLFSFRFRHSLERGDVSSNPIGIEVLSFDRPSVGRDGRKKGDGGYLFLSKRANDVKGIRWCSLFDWFHFQFKQQTDDSFSLTFFFYLIFFYFLGIPIGGKTGRRGSRPFLSPDAPPAATLMAALQTHRDSLSPDSAAEEALSGVGLGGLLGSNCKLRGRRDSRPHLSPDGECGGDGTSPRGSRIRRQSTTTDDIFKWVIIIWFSPIVFLIFIFR